MSKRASVRRCQFFAELTDCLRVHLQFQALGYSSIWGLSKAPKSLQIAPDLCRHQICLQCFSFDCYSTSDFLCVRRMRIGFCSEKHNIEVISILLGPIYNFYLLHRERTFQKQDFVVYRAWDHVIKEKQNSGAKLTKNFFLEGLITEQIST